MCCPALRRGTTLHALAAQKLFHQHDPADSLRCIPAEGDFRRAVLCRREVVRFILRADAGNFMFRRGGRGRQRGTVQQICTVAGAEIIAKFPQAGHIVFVEQSLPRRRNVQQAGGVAAHRLFKNVNQLVERTHLVILALVPEPAWANGSIHFCRIPDELCFVHQYGSAAQILVSCPDRALAKGHVICLLAGGGHLFGIRRAPRHNALLGFPGITRLVAAPADVRTADMDACVGLQTADGFLIALPVVVLLFAVGAFAVCAVEPHGENLTILGEQLG